LQREIAVKRRHAVRGAIFLHPIIEGIRLATLEKLSSADHIAASGLHDLSSGDAFRRDNGPLQPARGMKTIKTFSGCMLSLATQSGC
jgi:hypothetical protein